MVAWALKIALACGELEVMRGHRKLSVGQLIAQHVVLRIGDLYLDGDGVSTPDSLKSRWLEMESVVVKDIVPINSCLEIYHGPHAMPFSRTSVLEIASLFVKSM